MRAKKRKLDERLTRILERDQLNRNVRGSVAAAIKQKPEKKR
jgi:hypothetical protein